MISRIYTAHPGEGETFYMRILLNQDIVCTSFEDILTLLKGTVCHRSKEVACQRGPLDDNEYDFCLVVAASWNMPRQLRHLFVTILFYNEPCNPGYFRKNIVFIL